MNESAMSPADIAALTRNSNCGDGWGNGGSWWIIIFLIFAFMGGGWGGFGNRNGNNCATTEDLSNAMNFRDISAGQVAIGDQIDRKSQQITDGICNLGYENARLSNGIEVGMLNGFNNTNVNMLQGFNSVSNQIQSCCCETQRTLDRNLFESQKMNCETNAHIDAATQRIADMFTQNQMQTLRDQLNAANCQIANTALATRIVNDIRPYPIPAYHSCNPFASNGSCNYTAGCC